MDKKIAFLVGSPDISGGTYVIFQHAIYAMKQGAKVWIITDEAFDDSRLNWHPESKNLLRTTYEELSKNPIEFDLAFATWWKTVFNLGKVKAKQYSYFVQSIESWFYDSKLQNLRHLVDSTYTLPLNFITEATWIKDHLSENFNHSASLAHNGARKDIYSLEGPVKAPRENNKLRVLVEGPLGVSFKNVEKTIELCKQSNADEVWLLTSSVVDQYQGVDRLFSKVPISETAEIYRSCDVIVKLSYIEGMFGPPLEMFHCGGTCIVYDVTGHDEYIKNEHNGIVIKTDDEAGVVNAINKLKSDSNLLNELKSNAINTASKWPGWEGSSKKFFDEIDKNFKNNENHQLTIQKNTELFMRWYGIYGDTPPGSFKELIKLKFPRLFKILKALRNTIKS